MKIISLVVPVAGGSKSLIATALFVAGQLVGGIPGMLLASAGLRMEASLFAPGLPRPSDGKTVIRQAIPPRCRGYGYGRLAGYMMLDEQKKGNLYMIQAVHDSSCTNRTIAGFTGTFWLHDDKCTLDGSGNIVPPAANNDGRYKDASIQIQTRLGAWPETAMSIFTTDLPEIWTANHRGDGVASVGMRCNAVDAKNFQSIYPNGRPQLSAELMMQPVWDPRDVAQDANNPATWTFAAGRNPILALLDFERFEAGNDLTTRIMPQIASWKAAANVCDETLTTLEGVIPKYRLDFWYLTDNDPADIRAKILQACDAVEYETGDGAISVVAGKYVAPTVTLTANMITAVTIQRGVPDETAVNVITPTFSDRLQDYTQTDAYSWTDDADIALRGRRRPITAELSQTCTSNSQVQRLAKREGLRQQAPVRGKLTCNLAGLLVLSGLDPANPTPQRWVRIQYPRLPSLANCIVEVRDVLIDLTNLSCEIPFVSSGPYIDTWDYVTEEKAAPNTNGSVTVPVYTTPTGLNLVLSTTTGGQNFLSATFTPSGDATLGLMVMIRQRDKGDGNVGPWTYISQPAPAANSGNVSIGVVEPDVYDVAIQFRTNTGLSAGSASAVSTIAIGNLSDLGTDLIDYFDAEVAADLTLSGSAVTAWKAHTSAASFAQATAANQPVYSATSFNGRPGVTFDGVNDYLEFTGTPTGWPLAAVGCEMYAVADQQATTGTNRWAMAYGSNAAAGQQRLMGVGLSGGPLLAYARATDGTGTVQGTTYPLTGRHIVGAEFTGTAILGHADLRATSPASATTTTNTISLRSRLGASLVAVPTSFWQGPVNFAVITKPLTAAKRRALLAFLYRRAFL